MAEQQPKEMEQQILNVQETNCGNEFHCELKNFPVSFPSAIRRILLSNIPAVVPADIEIIENTTQIPHEMLKHRIKMLPINIDPRNKEAIREGKLELYLKAETGPIEVTTSQFASPNAIMKDRDFDTPLLFVRLRKGETIHIRSKLASEERTGITQVCNVSASWHIDLARRERALQAWIEQGGEKQVFDNFYAQKEWSRDSNGRPDWIDLNIESVGVISCRELVKYAVKILRDRLTEYVEHAKESVETLKDNEYRVSLEEGGHTICALMQEVIYNLKKDGDPMVNFVSYDIPHPLRDTTLLRFHSEESADAIINLAYTTIKKYCDVLEKGL